MATGKFTSAATKPSTSSSVTTTMGYSNSVFYLALLVTVFAVTVFPGPGIAEPYASHGFNIKQRSAAVQALRNLDHAYMSQNRPRFGKRFSSSSSEQFVPSSILSSLRSSSSGSSNEVGPQTNPVLSSSGSIIGERWILINRNKPLSKLTERYLRDMMADTEHYRADQSTNNEDDEEYK